MQETDYEGRTKLIPPDRWPTLYDTYDIGEAVAKSVANPKVASTTVHKPGSIAEINGRKYRLDDNGRWKRIKLPSKAGYRG